MRIIKSGKRNQGAFKFKCDKCGCKFEADVSDYIFVNKKIDENFQCYYGQSEGNKPTDIIECRCPNCDRTIHKEVYSYSDFPYRRILYATNAVTSMMTVGYLSSEEHQIKSLLFSMSLLLMFVNIILTFINEDK